MNFALVDISTTDFTLIFNHLTGRDRRYANMHLRDTRQVKKRPTLRYLHAMVVPDLSVARIDGAISGPGIFATYSLMPSSSGRAIWSFVPHRGSPEEFYRFGEYFRKRVLSRIAQEQAGNHNRPRRLPGEFYLRRSETGMPVTHRNCVAALQEQALDPAFVAILVPWKLELLNP